MTSSGYFDSNYRKPTPLDGSSGVHLSQQERLIQFGGHGAEQSEIIQKAASAEIGVFIRLPQSVLMDPSMSVDTKVVWSFIRTRAFDRDNPHVSRLSIPTIAVSTSIPEHRVKEAIKEIRMRQLSDVRQVKREAGRHNEYRSFDPKDFYGNAEFAFESWKTVGRIGALIQDWGSAWKQYEKETERRFANSKSVFFRSTERRITFQRSDISTFDRSAELRELEDIEEKKDRTQLENLQKNEEEVFYSKRTISVQRDEKLKSVIEYFRKKLRHASYLYLLKRELYKSDSAADFGIHLPSIEPIIIGLAFKELFTYSKGVAPLSHYDVFELIEVWAALGKCFDSPIEAIFFLNWIISNWTSVSPLFVENSNIETGRDEIAILLELIGREKDFNKFNCEAFVARARSLVTKYLK